MKENILIVEDEFIVANDLKFKLLKAGYGVCGIAATVTEAIEIIEKTSPSWVLLDIFLQDGSMGTDLAEHLSSRNIGFIYISANTNQSILEKAKATNPYGFLVKPFREKDLLIMLDIALQKHQNNLQLGVQRELIWRRQLSHLIQATDNTDKKLQEMPGTFQSFINFDFMSVEIPDRRESITVRYSYLRTGFNEYQTLTAEELRNSMVQVLKESAKGKPRLGQDSMDRLFNGIEYKKLLLEDIWEKQLSNFLQLGSKLIKTIKLKNGLRAVLNFYSKDSGNFAVDQLQLLQNTEREVVELLEQFTNTKTSLTPGATDQKNLDEKFTAQAPNKFDGIIGKSPALLRVLDRISMVASSSTSVLVTGESGTGKERVAQCLHKLSDRKSRPLVVVNCGALPYELIESELFGHEKGAFTGASDKRMGKFESANGGTIFLDEIGELPLDAQAKLLRISQEMEFERLGSNVTTKIDVRIIAATNRNLEKEVSEGRFRLDLYYRLNVFPISLPPLKERKEDIELLAEAFIDKYRIRMGKPEMNLSKEAITELKQYQWPGNIRELEHVIERAVLVTSGTTITMVNLNHGLQNAEPKKEPLIRKTLEQNEIDHIVSVLQSCHGKVGGPGGAAEILGLPASTLHAKMKKLGIKKGFDFDE